MKTLVILTLTLLVLVRAELIAEPVDNLSLAFPLTKSKVTVCFI
jgi:hypothetical protein